MTENTDITTPEIKEEVKEKVIGDFKPKKKFLNFVSAVTKLRVRFISDIAFIKGEKLAGLGLEGVIFKVTICDEGTIKFDEVDTTKTDVAYRNRLIDDICDHDVTGYTQKFVIADLEFADKDGTRCYLEVEHQKPIDKLKSLFDEVDAKKDISEKGLSFLDDLLADLPESEEVTEVVAVEEVKEEKEKSHSESMMEESFRKMNEDKVTELKNRVEDREKDIKKYKGDISFAESKLKEASGQLHVLNTRLESMTPGDEPNGHVFFVSEEQKNETGLDENTKEVADKIADLMNLKKEVLFKYLTGGFYKIKIGKKGENDKKLESIDKDVLEKLSEVDVLGKLTRIESNEFEYRGELNWHQLVSRMIRKGFEQDPDFNKASGSNSYESKEEDKSTEVGIELIQEDKDCSNCTNENCECDKDKDKDSCGCGSDCGCKDTPLVNTNQNNTQLLKSFDTPQDVVILGSYVEGKNDDFSITDDYSNFSLMVGDKNKFRSLESDGFVNLLSVPDFLKMIKESDSFEDGELDGSFDVVLLQNFSGDIRIGVKDEDGKTDYKFDTNDYILHQVDDYVEVVIYLPENTNATKVTNENLVALLRDGKINSILEK